MGIYSKNCPEWVLTDLATATLGGTVVPIHETFGQNAVELIINETQLLTITT
jgi:long-chain acyl-CoA synthetase